MVVKNKLVAQNPLILRCHRLMEAFAKSDDERDFYVDRFEGFLVYVDLDKSQDELDELAQELTSNSDRYCMIPKLTFYEVKKVMEGFVNEKVYDIDTKEKLLDIISSKEARENFLEFIYDHHTELEKWQQYYQERFRVRIIEWLRNNQFDFVFEEDLELTKSMCEKLKLNLFVPKVQKDLVTQRKNLMAKAKTYYSSEALNPRPKRGRPPKQVAKVETEPQFSQDIFTTIPKPIKSFLFAPDYHGSSAIFTFSGKFASEADLIAHRRQQVTGASNLDMQNLNQKLAALRTIATTWNVDKNVDKKENGDVAMPLLNLDVEPEIDLEIGSKAFNGEKAKQKKGKAEKVTKNQEAKFQEAKFQAAKIQESKEQAAKIQATAAKAPVKKAAPPSKVSAKPVANNKQALKPAVKADTKLAAKSKMASKAAQKSNLPPAKKVDVKVAKTPAKSSAKKSPVKAAVKPTPKAPPKMRLRPLPKKAKPAAKAKSVPLKPKPIHLRKLRRAKKK